MEIKTLIKTERLPGSWCPGCGIGTVINVLDKVMISNNMNAENTTIISGIGCSGRTSGYFNVDSIHTPHGRAIPVAEAIKKVNEELNVVVVSGDGDLLSIGLNHLIQAARKKVPITVLCINNQVYGMTGGQASPTTEKGLITLTTPSGATLPTIEPYDLFINFKNIFFGRATTSNPLELKEIINQAINYKGFSFVEIISPCHTNLGLKNNYKTFAEMYLKIRKEYHKMESNNNLKKYETGFIITK